MGGFPTLQGDKKVKNGGIPVPKAWEIILRFIDSTSECTKSAMKYEV